MWRALGVDVAMALVFAMAGLASHSQELLLGDILRVAWPFVAAAVGGSLLANRLAPTRWWLAGLIVAGVTAIGGIALRVLSGGGAEGTFVLVTAIVLTILMVGWRGVVAVQEKHFPQK